MEWAVLWCKGPSRQRWVTTCLWCCWETPFHSALQLQEARNTMKVLAKSTGNTTPLAKKVFHLQKIILSTSWVSDSAQGTGHTRSESDSLSSWGFRHKYDHFWWSNKMEYSDQNWLQERWLSPTVREGFFQEKIFEVRSRCKEKSTTYQLRRWVGSQSDSTQN